MITRITIAQQSLLSADLKYPKAYPTPQRRLAEAEGAAKAYDAYHKMLKHAMENPAATVADLYGAANMPEEDVTVTEVKPINKTSRRHTIYPHRITITEEDI